ncbi:hypothetical protein ACVW0Y_001334 [Pseudomonas sp. TE3786]
MHRRARNVAKLLTNLTFTQGIENSIMAQVDGSNAAADSWLDGMKSKDGGGCPPIPAVTIARVEKAPLSWNNVGL